MFLVALCLTRLLPVFWVSLVIFVFLAAPTLCLNSSNGVVFCVVMSCFLLWLRHCGWPLFYGCFCSTLVCYVLLRRHCGWPLFYAWFVHFIIVGSMLSSVVSCQVSHLPSLRHLTPSHLTTTHSTHVIIHTTHLTQCYSQDQSHTTHLAPLISHPSSHNPHFTQYMTPCIAQNSSNTTYSNNFLTQLSHTTCLTSCISHPFTHTTNTHNLFHTTHLTPLISPPKSHNLFHTTHLTPLISPPKSHTTNSHHSPHTTHFTPSIPHNWLHNTHLTQLISHQVFHTTHKSHLTTITHRLPSLLVPNAYQAERRKTWHVGFSGPFIFCWCISSWVLLSLVAPALCLPPVSRVFCAFLLMFRYLLLLR